MGGGGGGGGGGLEPDKVIKVPRPPSLIAWKVPLPKLEFWKSSVAAWLAPLVICSNPVVAL
jgi:hypothetical protein